MKAYPSSKLVLLAVTFMFCPSFAYADAAAWDARFIDPHPLPDDLKLPLPCGGAMVFRPVDVPDGKGILDDVDMTIGRPDTQEGYNQYTLRTHLAAAFPVQGHPELHRYYIGKYDVTVNQYAALNGSCPAPSRAGQKPQTGISWDEANAYAAGLTTWLLENRAPLPVAGGGKGFLRLPVDEEWSYAARGGMRVQASEFEAPLWPMPDGGPAAYIAAGPDIGEMQAVGQMKPNPLGLYDMLGNAGQMMLDPYRLNRVGRLQGKVGGLLIRGGDFHANPDELTTNVRAERPPYNEKTGKPMRDPAIGFRLVIGASALGSLKETEDAEKDFKTLLNEAQATPGDAWAALRALKAEAGSDPAMAGKLSRIETALTTDARARIDADKQVLGAQLQALAVLANAVWEINHVIDTITQAKMKLVNLTPQQAQKIEIHLAERQKSLSAAIESYLGLLGAAASSPAIKELDGIAAAGQDMLRSQNEDYLLGMQDLSQKNLEILHAGKKVTAQDILEEVKNIPAQ
ncbi:MULTISPECIES: SUMF1/EgtB/PvdO family nonheme iron enzyme [Acetobacter]|uniref:Sulfatase-modifying factor enzyme-like domain-containing protein n=3 Tax=Acetobacter TaxID=434 RepID=A0A841QIW9_9PROT|nr:SUMF1/EgtB/PvdO family nonheme iron enzyme [Acetobacter lovaniensis]MBB6458540.1 hypothetical protein [Acetobacter lovaniensis]MCI1795359.1 formylglycine-generating enzyme family protein [Acetobacter lovaniensis]MCP1240706.1 formylglycine-generating enzyme family protein [Acetobacter lovaniensis]NHN82741.1 SUMF1/EgtB/PvdO family nonheme iron enzyme [Acetobacter lovaniensis]